MMAIKSSVNSGRSDFTMRLFGEEVKVSTECCDEDKEWNGDWYYTFGIESEELYGYFDIYYLKMREQPEDDDDGLRFFVNEVTYTFE